MSAAYVLADFATVLWPHGYRDIISLALITVASVGALSRGRLWALPDPYHHLWFERPQEKDNAVCAADEVTRNIAQKMEECEKQLVVFWGSQSGTAEGFANRFARECFARFGLETIVADLSDYDPETIALIPLSKFAVFILSTFGEGDPPDNTTSFWDWIHRASEVSLKNLRYMSFGLGNSNYKYYNLVADRVTAALEKFGAISLMPVGRADDAEGGTEEDFIAWKEAAFKTFRKKLGLEEHELRYVPVLSIEQDDSLDIIDLHHGEPMQRHSNRKTAGQTTHIKALTVKNSRELYTTPHRNCLHVDLDLSDQPEMHYKTGDHLAIWPSNPDGEVDRLLRVLGLAASADVPLLIKSLDASIKLKFPTPTSTTALFRYYLEICSPISRDTVRTLAAFAPHPAAKVFLLRISADKATYAAYQNTHILTLGRLLATAAGAAQATDTTIWSTLPLSFILETLPYIQPRYYSISSSSITAPRTPSITAAVSIQPLPNASPESEGFIHGLTTNYLLALSQNLTVNSPRPHPHGLTYNLSGPNGALGSGKLYAHIRRSKFKMPALASRPIIMVAAGTGIAPFRAFVTERARMASMSQKPVGRMLLFFGCRRADEDYLYREELEEAQTLLGGTSSFGIKTAFSREPGQEKFYVQDRIREAADQLCTLLVEQNANFYVCGSATMAREVTREVRDALQHMRNWSEKEWNQWNDKQKRTNRWQEDVWD